MCREMDRVYNDGDKRRQVKVALNMIDENYSTEQIVRISELTEAEVTRLQERKIHKEGRKVQQIQAAQMV